MKVRLKMTISMVCLLSIIFGIGGSSLISIAFNHSLNREQEAAYNAYQMVVQTLFVVNSVKGPASYQDLSNTLAQLSTNNTSVWSAVRLTSPNGISYENGAALNFLQPTTEDMALNSCSISYINGQPGHHYIQFSGVFVTGISTMTLDMAYDISAVYNTRNIQQNTYQIIFLVMIALCVFLSYSVSWFLTRPLAVLSRASKKLAAGDLSYRAPIASHDEIGGLAADFNSMAVQLEANMIELKSSLERQERFMGSFAHELKTPMTSIIGYADLLRSHPMTPEEQAEAANYIFSESKRLERLSLKLLDLIVLQKQDLPLTLAQPGKIVDNVAENLKAFYQESGIELQTQSQPGFCFLEPDLLQSLLLNLLDNARKALDSGGEIKINVAMTDDGCQIIVQDSGRGIPNQALERLTEAFYRVDKARCRHQGGSGLGLALCHAIVGLHHGSLKFYSQEGRGTTVVAHLKGGRHEAQN